MPRTSAVTPDHFTTFGELLKFLRRRAGLTQRELSIGVGYSESQISRLEQNQRPPDQAALAARFVPALHVEKEPEWAARLLDLAVASRAEADPDEAEPLVETASTPHGNTRFPHGYNLPLQLTSFIGREKEIAEVKQLLSQARLVTLTGAGGAGKTRLALQVAASLLNAFPDGVWLVELAPLADPALVPQSVAAVLGLRDIVDRPVIDLLLDQLRLKQLLLVLDNCEHLVQACAELAETLLRGCPQLNILATSRESLGIAGESAYHLRSLSVPEPNQTESMQTVAESESARLFIERAATALPGFELTAENAAAVAQICRQLDGIPLAIELAAARVNILRAEQIAARLAEHERFRLLTSGSRTASRRHQTLTALMDWSYDLLPAPEQRLLERLAVFAGGWTLEAAEAVGGDNVLDLLAQLANKSLVLAEREPGAEVRYGMLETIRQYALAKLAASGELDSVRQAHAAYFLSLAEGEKIRLYEWRPGWHDRMQKELDNLRAALAWSVAVASDGELGLRLAVATTWVWGRQVEQSESCRWLEAALAHADALSTPVTPARANALELLGHVLANQGNKQAAQARWEQGRKVSQELGDLASAAHMLERLGWLAREYGDATTARLRLEESLALAREIGDQAGIGNALGTLAGVAILQEDPRLATGLLEESLALHRQREDAYAIGWALNDLGLVAQLEGDFVRAGQRHEESQQFLRGNPVGESHVALAFGEIALAQGQATLATKHFAWGLAEFRDPTDRAGMSWCLAGLAGAAVLDEEPERAARLWGAAEALRSSIGARQAPASRATRERLMAAARQQLGDVAFDAEWAAGQALTVEQAIALALDSR